MKGKRFDKAVIGKKVNKQKIEQYFKKAFNPALIDIDIVNTLPVILDIPAIKANASKQISKGGVMQAQNPVALKYINNINNHVSPADTLIYTTKDKQGFTQNLIALDINQAKVNNNATEISLFLTYLKCSTTNVDGTISYTNGVSFTGMGISAMFLKNGKMDTSVEVPHEIMHAIFFKTHF